MMHSMLEKLIGGLSKATDQNELNMVAQSMFSSGILKEITPEEKKDITGFY